MMNRMWLLCIAGLCLRAQEAERRIVDPLSPVEMSVVETPLPTPTPAPTPVPGEEAESGGETASGAVNVTVLGDRVNLRTESTVESEVVGRANYGQVLQAISFSDEWVEVVPPAAVAVWVYSPLLFEDREVRATEMNVRSGPGTQFAKLGMLTRGTPVTVLDALGEWRKILPPASITLWISRDYVQVPVSVAKVAPPEPTPTARPLPRPTPVTIVEIRTVEKIVEVPVLVEPTPVPAVEAPAGLDLVPLRGQGTLSRRRGRVKAYLLAAGNPSRFSLERPDGTVLCYLVGDEEVLKAAAGRTVLVSGRDYWVTGEKLPVTDVTSLKAAGEETAP